MKTADILRKAVEMEEYGHLTYKAQAEAATDPLLKAFLSELSNDEARHRDWFEALASGAGEGLVDAAKRIPSLESRMMKYFHGEVPKDHGLGASAQEAALEAAMGLEKESYDFYTEIWRSAESDSDRALFDMVRREEYDHMVGIENILAYLTRTGQWFDREESKRWNWMV